MTPNSTPRAMLQYLANSASTDQDLASLADLAQQYGLPVPAPEVRGKSLRPVSDSAAPGAMLTQHTTFRDPAEHAAFVAALVGP